MTEVVHAIVTSGGLQSSVIATLDHPLFLVYPTSYSIVALRASNVKIVQTFVVLDQENIEDWTLFHDPHLWKLDMLQ